LNVFHDVFVLVHPFVDINRNQQQFVGTHQEHSVFGVHLDETYFIYFPDFFSVDILFIDLILANHQ